MSKIMKRLIALIDIEALLIASMILNTASISLVGLLIYKI